MNVLDLVAVAIIAIGAYRGFRYGFFSSAISLFGSLLIFVLAYYLKNPLSVFMYQNLPFRNYGGIFEGITSFNILVYEGIAYIICIAILALILRYVIKVTGIIDKFLNMTMILALPSKLLGLLFGGLQYFIYTFILLFVLSIFPITASNFKDSTVSIKIVESTPILSNMTNDLYITVSDVYDVCEEARNDKDGNGDYKALEVLLKQGVVSPEGVKKLVEKNKIAVEGVDKLIQKYTDKEKEENND